MIIKFVLLFFILFSLLSIAKNHDVHNSYIRNYSSEQQTIETINIIQLEQLIQNRNGNILFLNIWATWCVPCRKEFPAIIQLNKKYKNQNVDIVTISVDYPDEKDTKVIPFLKSTGANFTTFIADLSSDTDLIESLDSTWSGAIPATFIYNKKGIRTGFLMGETNLIDFEDEIEKAKTSSQLK